MSTSQDLLRQAIELQRAGHADRAEAICRDVLAGDSENATAWQLLGVIRHMQGDHAGAVDHLRRAIAIDGSQPERFGNLAASLLALGRTDQAIDTLRQAMARFPAQQRIGLETGVLLTQSQRWAEAADCFQHELLVQPTNAAAHYNLATVLDRLNRPGEAIASYRRALSLRPNYVEAQFNLARLLKSHGEFAEAQALLEQVLSVDPQLARAHFLLGSLLALQGDFGRGLAEIEWRWKSPDFPQPAWSQPMWDGGDLAGRTILLHCEQGLGDTLQFVRYAPLIKERGGFVILAAPRSLLPLLSTCAGIDRFWIGDTALPKFDVQSPLMSLPYLFRTDLRSIPAKVPYLSAAQGDVEKWQAELGDDGRLRVGICWQANPNFVGDRERSMRLAEFAPLAAVPGVRLLSLQKGVGVEQLAGASFAVEDWGSRLDNQEVDAVAERAAVIQNLDLMITVDTGMAHLAGALGVPTWVALSASPDWRWLLDRQDSPWYPTMRLFRQARIGEWAAVFERIAGELAGRARQESD